MGSVLLGDRYPQTPPPTEYVLTEPHPCRTSLETLYKNLFHGPVFQGVTMLGQSGNEGIEARMRTMPREGLFRGNPQPQYVFDPVFADVLTHPLGGWHLEQPDQAGRTLLPYELSSLELFGPAPPAGAEFTVRARVDSSSLRRFVHTYEAIDEQGRLFCRLRGKFWRFYLPFGKYQFHGPKDEYFLSYDWPEALPEPASAAAAPPPAWCMRLAPPADLTQPGLQLAGARVTLSPDELTQFYGLREDPARMRRWLFSRLVAKDTVRSLRREHSGERCFPADVEIEEDAQGRFVPRPRGGGPERFPTCAWPSPRACSPPWPRFNPRWAWT